MTHVQTITEVLTNTLTTGIPFPLWDIFLIITILGGLLFFAIELRIGAMILFILLASELIMFYTWGWPTLHVLLAFLVCLVIMAISIYISYAKKSMGVVY